MTLCCVAIILGAYRTQGSRGGKNKVRERVLWGFLILEKLPRLMGIKPWLRVWALREVNKVR